MAETQDVSEGEKNGEEEEECGITMLDVLEDEQELEEDANAVLGGSDDKNCTYPMGYVKRQALYACGTCSTVDKDPAGICLACSYACHEGHELLELYTKRGLLQKKDGLNYQNEYNHNFRGRYCSCERPYPDPDDEVPDEMVQCIICEDWYHGRHLGEMIPENQDFSEMICSWCMEKLPFLWSYSVQCAGEKILVGLKLKEGKTDENVDVEGGDKDTSKAFTDHDVREITIKSETFDSQHMKMENRVTPGQNIDTSKESHCASIKDAVSVENDTQKCQEDEKGEIICCLLRTLPKYNVPSVGPTFWTDGWRKKLCKCTECMKLYFKNKCLFLLDEEDTVHFYEEHGRSCNDRESQYDKGLSVLQNMDRVRQVEAIYEYNTMKSELKDYLKKFADSKKVVREEDIREFFSQMQARKRRRVDCHIPEFCR
ncbi:putative E3 ubiquitin-protein ligase UBR7 [Limulus polyphemus]|uniref:E3 ubiquitin-protein ligase UBR7 n=1 Tax=Limulus polyphemus TaxID=6850 RepID=A0ABM1SBU7_LIMPO|nr:putative E3 ubiquitin-protein ligase UBR7 [Limulus polyphemus]